MLSSPRSHLERPSKRGLNEEAGKPGGGTVGIKLIISLMQSDYNSIVNGGNSARSVDEVSNAVLDVTLATMNYSKYASSLERMDQEQQQGYGVWPVCSFTAGACV